MKTQANPLLVGIVSLMLAIMVMVGLLSYPWIASAPSEVLAQSSPEMSPRAYLPYASKGDPTTPTFGETKTLVLRVNLTDASVACTEAELEASMCANTNSVNAVYSESSRGALTIIGDVAAVNIDYSSAEGCVREDWVTAADEAAATAGYNLGDYDRFVYIMPEDLFLREVCRWVGSVSIGTNWVWSLRCKQPKILAHELGHTFGLYHASTDYTCYRGTEPIGEYCDHSDPMGAVGAPFTQVNGPHPVQMGWLPDAAVQDVNVDGVYSIEATEIDPDAATYPQILRLEKPYSNEYYYVSFRRPIGLHANLIGYVNTYCDDTYLDLATVHRFRGFGSAPGYGSPNTYLVALLAEGDSFADTSNGITIAMVSHQGDVATVRIEL